MEEVPIYCRKRVLIVGCGNKLFGDDGFGPEVIEYLANNYSIPEEVCLLDVGTGFRKILFTVSLSNVRPQVVVVIDAVDKGRRPGEIFEIPLDEIPEKIRDFSVHQVPSSNLLKDLKDTCSLEVRILSCQVEKVPDQVQSGLSQPVQEAVPLLAKRIVEEYF